MKRVLQTLRQIYESLNFALQSIVVNRLRTFLSLLGITIGIFAIISVYTAIDSLEGYIRNSLSAISSNMIQVGRWPWTQDSEGEYKWWKYVNYPNMTHDDYLELKEQLPSADAAAIALYYRRLINYGNNSMDNVGAIGGTYDYIRMRSSDIDQGRYFTPFEMQSGTNSAIIGANIAEELFAGEDPIGKSMKIGGSKVDVIGVFAKQGNNMFGNSWDEEILVPFNYAKTKVNVRWADPEVYLIAKEGVDTKEFYSEIEATMRRIRRLAPASENNFVLNEVSAVSSQVDSIFTIINLAGGIIGIFSILVGGFGVANIMFVSVRERTVQIGIQKALGAKPYFILLQFVFEAVLLAIVGGAVGLMLIWVATVVVSNVSDFEVVLSFKNILIGLGISSVVGAVSGIFPAYSAATMEPVKAISKS